MLQLKDTRYNDVRLIFHEEEHKYNDSLGNNYTSTTTLLHEYQPKFDKSYWLKKKARELGISQKELAKQWQTITDEACERGTNTHNGLENGIKGSSKFKRAVEHLRRPDGQMITVADLPNINLNIDIEHLTIVIAITTSFLAILTMMLSLIVRNKRKHIPDKKKSIDVFMSKWYDFEWELKQKFFYKSGKTYGYAQFRGRFFEEIMILRFFNWFIWCPRRTALRIFP